MKVAGKHNHIVHILFLFSFPVVVSFFLFFWFYFVFHLRFFVSLLSCRVIIIISVSVFCCIFFLSSSFLFSFLLFFNPPFLFSLFLVVFFSPFSLSADSSRDSPSSPFSRLQRRDSFGAASFSSDHSSSTDRSHLSANKRLLKAHSPKARLDAIARVRFFSVFYICIDIFFVVLFCLLWLVSFVEFFVFFFFFFSFFGSGCVYSTCTTAVLRLLVLSLLALLLSLSLFSFLSLLS